MTKENHILIFFDVALHLHFLLWLEPATESKYQKPEAHSETSEIELFLKIVNSLLCPPPEIMKKPTIPDKILGTKRRNPVKVDRKKEVWYLILRVESDMS